MMAIKVTDKKMAANMARHAILWALAFLAGRVLFPAYRRLMLAHVKLQQGLVPPNTTTRTRIMNTVPSTSDQRTANNAMRHEYRVLTEQEKAAMYSIKDKGVEFFNLIDSLGASRELSLAKTKIEEAVMWGVKHITK